MILILIFNFFYRTEKVHISPNHLLYDLNNRVHIKRLIIICITLCLVNVCLKRSESTLSLYH